MFTKYPKTFHLPWSPGLQNDDRRMPVFPFDDKEVVITEKMDGENTTMYHDHIHARSLDSAHHESRDWVKMFWGTIRHDIPPRLRICGENVFAEHSIHYNDLRSYFLGFSVWEGDVCLDWDTTMEYFELLGITPVPIIYEGTYYEWIEDEIISDMDLNKQEGYVIRLRESFSMNDFQTSVGKYVRKGHVQTDEFWRHKPVVPNELAE